jgi:hypothetical protein
MIRSVSFALVIVVAVGLATADDKKAGPALPGSKSKLPAVAGYERRVLEGFQILINKIILDKPMDDYAKKPFDVLEDELKSINKLIIPKILHELQKVPIWVEWDGGEKKANGSRTVAVYYGGPAFAYLRRDSAVDPRKANNIEVMTLKFLTELKQPGRNKQQVVLLHELVHAVHDKVLSRDNPEIKAAYEQAKQRELYVNVEHRTGPKRDAYANTNHAEYFAEISCAFLDHIDYYPYDKEGLRKHDPEGYAVAEKVWGKVVAKPKPEIARAVTPMPKSEPAPKMEVDKEKVAATKLELIRELIKEGKKDRAKERLKELIETYPDTKAAADAKNLLEELK